MIENVRKCNENKCKCNENKMKIGGWPLAGADLPVVAYVCYKIASVCHLSVL